MEAYLTIKAYPDVLPALQALRLAGIRLAFVSNMTERMLDAATRSSGLDGLFEQILSTDRVRAYKPDPRAYQMAIDAFGLRREDIVFAAFNRLKLPAEELDAMPDAIGDSMTDLLRFVGLA